MLDRPLSGKQSLSDDSGPIKTWKLLLSTFLAAWAIAIYVYIIFAIPSFEKLFSGFGADLPTLTSTVIKFSKYAIVFALVVVFPLASMWWNRASGSLSENQNLRRVIIGFLIALIIGTVTVFALYLPVFKMGAVVS
jgi:type II secretory pathway component PulF